jgi:cardiolipin synthase
MAKEITNDESIDVFATEESAWEEMLVDINQATHSIIFEQFILLSYQDGKIGKKFVDAFIAAANRGVDVMLHLDGLGSYELLFNSKIKDQIKLAGIKLHFYRTTPLEHLTTPIRVFIRNHRKVLLVDKKISWLGGVIMAEEFRDWHDYTWRVDSEEFGKALDVELSRQFDRLETGKRILAPFSKISPRLRLVGNSPGIGNRHVYEQISEHILLAENRIVLVSPYFVPPLRLRRVIEEKLNEGVEVVLLTPHQTDHRLADWARWPYLWRLYSRGLKVMTCDQMNHAKIAVADKWATFGSTNLDFLSLIFNHELNLDTDDENLVTIINTQINSWLDHNYTELNRSDLILMRPNLFHRLLGRILRPLT